MRELRLNAEGWVRDDTMIQSDALLEEGEPEETRVRKLNLYLSWVNMYGPETLRSEAEEPIEFPKKGQAVNG